MDAIVEYTLDPNCPNSTSAVVAVKMSGDTVWVKDTCSDGRSAVSQVTYPPDEHLICRNPHGVGTWARCDYDWPENPIKQITAGVYNGNTGYLNWHYGASVYRGG